MARILITGSSTGLGLIAGQHLAQHGHAVVLHARNASRARDAITTLSEAESVVVGDLETIRGAADVAAKVNALGRFDAVIHNAAVGYNGGRRVTEDGIPVIFAVNVLAPYILTSLIMRPERLVYISSSMHLGADANLDDVLWQRRRWSGSSAYSESKLHILLLAFALPRLWPGVTANGVDPGWVPTRMGGANAPDDLVKGCTTQAVLAAPDPGSPLAGANGQYFHHLRPRDPNPQSRDISLQDQFLTLCADLSGFKIKLPKASQSG
jgi:NAD(P)-dependent dehydrogenase (short-subunit alcohol dehydrogenase family)